MPLLTIRKSIFKCFEKNKKTLTITINVNSTGIPLAIVVSVRLVGVGLEHTVVAAVANVISVRVILGRVVHSWAVILI